MSSAKPGPSFLLYPDLALGRIELDLRQLVERFNAKVPQEGVRRLVEDRPAERLTPARLLDEAAVQQRLHGVIALVTGWR